MKNKYKNVIYGSCDFYANSEKYTPEAADQ